MGSNPLRWAAYQFKVLKDVGGLRGAYKRLVREGTVRWGTFVGEDKYGNKYYENNEEYFIGRNRFVVYPHSDKPYRTRLEFDATQIPSEWHRWMQYITDDPPSVVPPEPKKFLADHTLNYSGSNKEYIPYSTTRPKIQAWVPPKNSP